MNKLFEVRSIEWNLYICICNYSITNGYCSHIYVNDNNYIIGDLPKALVRGSSGKVKSALVNRKLIFKIYINNKQIIEKRQTLKQKGKNKILEDDFTNLDDDLIILLKSQNEEI